MRRLFRWGFDHSGAAPKLLVVSRAHPGGAHPGGTDDALPGSFPATEIAFCLGADVVVALAWAMWWHLVSTSGGFLGALWDALVFLSWTLLPCTVLAVGIGVALFRWARPSRRWRAPRVQAAASFIAPTLWCVAYCQHYGDLGYIPTALLIALAAWIITFQPVWAFVLTRLLSARSGTPPLKTPAP